MRAIDRSLLLLAAAFVFCLVPASSFASGCNREIVVPVRFAQGAVCWQHVGPGTTFTGQFGAGQHVSAAAIGQFENADGNRTWTSTGTWQISISGPAGFFANGENGQLDTVLPRAGAYSFQIGPCAVWGAPGMIEICAQ
jgi:hypothetical protein